MPRDIIVENKTSDGIGGKFLMSVDVDSPLENILQTARHQLALQPSQGLRLERWNPDFGEFINVLDPVTLVEKDVCRLFTAPTAPPPPPAALFGINPSIWDDVVRQPKKTPKPSVTTTPPAATSAKLDLTRVDELLKARMVAYNKYDYDAMRSAQQQLSAMQIRINDILGCWRHTDARIGGVISSHIGGVPDNFCTGNPTLDAINKLIFEREQNRFMHYYDQADLLRVKLRLEYGVAIDDENRAWHSARHSLTGECNYRYPASSTK